MGILNNQFKKTKNLTLKLKTYFQRFNPHTQNGFFN